MRWMLLVCLCLIVTPVVLSAQDTVPWPPDPTLIFQPGIQAPLVEPGPAPTLPPNQPQIDNERQIVRVYDADTDEWREYPFPSTLITGLRVYTQAPPDQVWLYDPVLIQYGYNDIAIPRRTWILDQETGTYSQPESICDHHFPPEAGEGKWVYYAPPESPAYLCFTGDGTLKGPLPAEYDWGQYALEPDYQPELSPTGEWLVIMAPKVDAFGSLYVHSYELATGTIHLLGTVEQSDSYKPPVVVREHWHESTAGWLFQSTRTNPLASWYYSFNVTRSDSLESRFGQPSFEITPWTEAGYGVLNVPSANSLYYGSSGDDTCNYTIYGPESEQRFEIAYDCIPTACERFWQLDESLVMLTIDSPEVTTSSLITFDPLTGAKHTLIQGEIERILGISGGRYITLLIENDGELTPAKSCQFPEMDRSASWGGRLYIYDLQSGGLTQLTERAGELNNQVWWPHSESVTVLMQGYATELDLPSGDRIPMDYYSHIVLYTSLNDGRIERSVMYYDLSVDEAQISPDGRYLHYEADGQLYILDLATQATTALLQMETVRENGYEIYANWSLRESILLLVRVKDSQTEFRIELSSTAPPR